MNTDRVTALYDAIDAFQRTHRLPGLQHAQIRGLLAEHLARALPAPVPVPSPADQTALRAAVAAPTDWIDGHPQLETIAAAVWERCEHHDSGLIIDDPRNIAVTALAAVLAVLSEQTDRAAVLREAADTVFALEFHKCGRTNTDFVSFEHAWDLGTIDAASKLRRVAAEEQPAEAHPSHDSWLVEWRAKDGDWAVAYPTHDHGKALDRLARGQQEALDWQWRLVRETSTYTVEAEHTPPTERPAVGEQPETPETLPPPEGPEYTPCICDHIEPEHEPDAGACWSCDCETYRPTPPAPLLRSEDACPGFPERCPNLRTVDPNPPTHLGGIRCGCADPTTR